MGELSWGLLSLRFDLLLCCIDHTTYVTVNNLLLNSFSTKRKGACIRNVDMWIRGLVLRDGGYVETRYMIGH